MPCSLSRRIQRSISAGGVTPNDTAALPRMPPRIGVRWIAPRSRSSPAHGSSRQYFTSTSMNELAAASITSEAGPVEHVRHRQGHPRLHAHAPEALLAVAQRLVQQVNVRLLAVSSITYSSRSSFLSTLPAVLRGSSSTTRYSFGRLWRAIASRQRRVERRLVHRGAGAGDEVGHHALAPFGIRTPITAASPTAGLAQQDVLDLARVDVVAAGDHDVLGPVHQRQVAGGVERARGRRCGASRRAAPGRSPPACRGSRTSRSGRRTTTSPTSPGGALVVLVDHPHAHRQARHARRRRAARRPRPPARRRSSPRSSR